MASALEHVPHLSRARCREQFEKRFTVERMVQDYLRVYEAMVSDVGNLTRYEAGLLSGNFR
jgi:hypothetical protein